MNDSTGCAKHKKPHATDKFSWAQNINKHAWPRRQSHEDCSQAWIEAILHPVVGTAHFPRGRGKHFLHFIFWILLIIHPFFTLKYFTYYEKRKAHTRFTLASLVVAILYAAKNKPLVTRSFLQLIKASTENILHYIVLIVNGETFFNVLGPITELS